MNRLKEKFVPERKIVLLEGSGGPNIRFEFARADEKNGNGRIYPEAVLSSAVRDAQKRIEQGVSLLGTSDHHDELQVDDVSHRISRLMMRGRDAVAEAAILSTAKGKNLTVIINSGGSLGVSMRGTGTVKEGIVSDFCLEGIDVCLAPSFNTRISQANIFESVKIFEGDGLRPAAKPADDKEAEAEEAKVRELYGNACRSGFNGSFADYVNNVYLLRFGHGKR